MRLLNKTIISIPLSHFGDDATKYPLRTPWYRRHGKRELFPARLSTTSRPWFDIVIALSKSLAGHSSFVAKLGPKKGVVPSTTIYFKHHCTSVSCRSFPCFEKSAKTQLQSHHVQTVGSILCLISFIWTQSTCQDRMESDKIQNENSCQPWDSNPQPWDL